MGSKLGGSRKTSRGRSKTASVRKLSPEQPAARDEGPRLIPLGQNRDAGLGRIEHYLELADRALGHVPAKQRAVETSVAAPGTVPIVQQPPPPILPPPLFPPFPPKLNLPRPPALPNTRRKPPKLTRAMPPEAPRFPKPPKLMLPKPPSRRNAGRSKGPK